MNSRGAVQPSHRVDLVDALAALVTLPADPVAVEVGTDAVQHLAGEAVVLPLLRVELEHALVHQVLPVLGGEGGEGGDGGRARRRVQGTRWNKSIKMNNI